tara:strand:+ start:773 stop:1360 length:588 start_codon:yes stop_codon:yes gene_type:complete
MLNYIIRKRILLSRIFVVSMIVTIIINDNFRVNTLNISDIQSLGLSIIGFILVTLGGFGRLWASLYVEGFKTKRLITEGPYSMVRNPLYFFTIIILLGFCCVVKSIPIAIALLAGFSLLHIPAIINEEKKLLSKHDHLYKEYYHKTPRLIPNIFKYKRPISTDRIEVKIKKINNVIWEIIGYFMLYLAIDLYILI